LKNQKNIEESIKQRMLLKIKHPKYGDIFANHYIVANQIIAFHLSDDDSIVIQPSVTFQGKVFILEVSTPVNNL